jgi:hypothetical protein
MLQTRPGHDGGVKAERGEFSDAAARRSAWGARRCAVRRAVPISRRDSLAVAVAALLTAPFTDAGSGQQPARDPSPGLDQSVVVTARDPWIRPFAPSSIWNTPLGSNAQYRPADLPYTEHHALEHVYLLQTDESDPEQEIFRTGAWRDRCSGTEQSEHRLHLPDGWQPQPVGPTGPTPNNPGVFLLPDRRTLLSLGAMGRCDVEGPLFGQWPGPDKHLTDLYGDGRSGAHGASKLSQIGGALRPGELTGEEPIRHALDLLIWSEHLYWGGTKESTYRWPAFDSDDYAGPDRYRGRDPELVMGSLVAIPPWMEPDDVGVRSDVGRLIFQALQDYGAYITDDSAWDATYIGVDSEAIGTFPWGGAERRDMANMVQALHVVTNNGPSSIGGGGQPRQPLLDELLPPPASGSLSSVARPMRWCEPLVDPPSPRPAGQN